MNKGLTRVDLERIADGRQHDPVVTKDQARELLKLGRVLRK